MTTELTPIPPASLPADPGALPDLLARAVATLEGAKSAAEVLEAGYQADAVYNAAKTAEHLLRAQGAHADVIAACQKMRGDALVIEARAEVRLATEFDAAQARGEVASAGYTGHQNSDVPDENVTPSTADIGLSRKQVFNARQTRDAELADPGVVQRTVDAALKAGRSPTKADKKRATAKASGRVPAPRKPVVKSEEAVVIASLSEKGLTGPQIAEQTGVSKHTVRRIVETERTEKDAYERGFAAGIEAADIDPTKFYKTVQEQTERMKRNLWSHFDAEVRKKFLEDIEQHYDKVLLPQLRAKEAKANDILMRRRGVLTGKEYTLILSFLHGDQNPSAERILAAKTLWEEKKAEIVIAEREKAAERTIPSDFPQTREELLARRQKVKDDRAARLRATREAKRASA